MLLARPWVAEVLEFCHRDAEVITLVGCHWVAKVLEFYSRDAEVACSMPLGCRDLRILPKRC